MEVVKVKKCTVCKYVKSYDKFDRNKRNPTGRACSCKVCGSNAKRRRRNTFEGQRAEHGLRLKRKFGLTSDDYWDMMKAQDGVCAICGNPETQIQQGRVQPLGVDHNHDTGAVRGLLCAGCNNGIGRFRDDIELLKKAIEYLEKYEEE